MSSRDRVVFRSPAITTFPGGRGLAGDGAFRSLRNVGASRRPRARRIAQTIWHE